MRLKAQYILDKNHVNKQVRGWVGRSDSPNIGETLQKYTANYIAYMHPPSPFSSLPVPLTVTLTLLAPSFDQVPVQIVFSLLEKKKKRVRWGGWVHTAADVFERRKLREGRSEDKRS